MSCARKPLPMELKYLWYEIEDDGEFARSTADETFVINYPEWFKNDGEISTADRVKDDTYLRSKGGPKLKRKIPFGEGREIFIKSICPVCGVEFYSVSGNYATKRFNNKIPTCSKKCGSAAAGMPIETKTHSYILSEDGEYAIDINHPQFVFL